jgi:hypothetical protein
MPEPTKTTISVEQTVRVLPGGIAAALMTRRPELVKMVAAEVRLGTTVLTPEDQAELIGLIGDLISQSVNDQERLRQMILTIKGIREFGKGLEGQAERLMVLVAECGVEG